MAPEDCDKISTDVSYCMRNVFRVFRDTIYCNLTEYSVFLSQQQNGQI